MRFIDGFGGVFLYSDDPARLTEWYRDTLDLAFEGAWEGSPWFAARYRDRDDPTLVRSTTWAILPRKGGTAPAGNVPTAMVNWRVKDMEALRAHLASRGVTLGEVVSESYGKFAHIVDPEGNRIEFYEEAPVREPLP